MSELIPQSLELSNGAKPWAGALLTRLEATETHSETERLALVALIREEITRSQTIDVRVRRFRPGATLPKKGTELAAGFDLYACLGYAVPAMAYDENIGGKVQYRVVKSYSNEDASNGMVRVPYALNLNPSSWATIPTGLNVRLPADAELQIRPRSGLAHKNAVTVLNAPGTLDADFDGDGEDYELKLIVINHGGETVMIGDGMKLAQGVFAKVAPVNMIEDFAPNFRRNVSSRSGGLGSTGV